MAKHKKTLKILEAARAILAADHPMTVRQVYYRLVAGGIIKNNEGRYNAVGNLLRDARKEAIIPWEWIEDRLRRPRTVSMWSGLSDFADVACQAYRRDVWDTQPKYVECWLEKDALSGIFEDILSYYGVTLNVGRGYDGWSSIQKAAERYGDGEHVAVLYFGDFDPSGEDMVRSLRERLAFFGACPKIEKCALTLNDIRRYSLPADFAKVSDARAKEFIEKYGDIAVELDALPSTVLRERIVEEIEKQFDLQALEEVKQTEEIEREQLRRALD